MLTNLEIKMIFTSKHTVYCIEDEILVIAFANSKKSDPDQYVILQKDLGDDELYSYEINLQAFSNEGGITEVSIFDTKLQLFFAESEALYKQGITSPIINHDADAKLKSLLSIMFEKTDVVLTIP